jgi:aspartyl-tRNA(Asn)/glutamyl-tRNA(Gln) amidotransferase subunit A
VSEPLGTLSELREALGSGRISSAELVEASLTRAQESSLNAMVGLRREGALVEAAEADARRARGDVRSPLDGIPVALKDNIAQRGEPCGCASRILEGYASPYDATAAARLREAGAVIVGRTNMDEFAMGSSTENSAVGPARNPWDIERAPGGSSGGSAAVVADGIVPVAFGSDTGGSIRQPASLCGVVGVKPTYGRVSRYGLVAFASSLDQIGPFARSSADAAAALQVVAGHDANDSTSLPDPAPAYADALSGDVSGLVIGLPREYFVEDGVDSEVLACVRDAVAELEKAGATTREISLPHTGHAIATYYLVANAEASSNLSRFDGVRYGRRADSRDLGELYRKTRSEGFGPEVKRRILLGTYVLSAGYYDAYYRKAQQVRTLIRRDFENAFATCDVIATPTAPETAFRIGERSDNPLRMYLSDVYTVSASLAGICGLSTPCGLVGGLPAGLQLLAPALGEPALFRTADAYERLTDWHALRPGGRS